MQFFLRMSHAFPCKHQVLYPDHLEGSGYDSHTRASIGLTLTICWQVEVVEGELECPESGRKFPISEGIPNMLLREDEV